MHFNAFELLLKKFYDKIHSNGNSKKPVNKKVDSKNTGEEDDEDDDNTLDQPSKKKVVDDDDDFDGPLDDLGYESFDDYDEEDDY